MPQFVSDKTYFLNADKSKVVAEDDPDASFLLVREGAAIDQAEADRYGLKLQAVEVYDAVADHAAKHGGETAADANARRTAMLAGEPDPDGSAVEGERGEKARAATENKAVAKAPANK